MADKTTPNPAAAPSKRDHRTHLVFVVVAIMAAVAVWLYQRKPPNLLEKWDTNLEAALAQAKNENRKVLVYFISDPPGEAERWMNDHTLARPENEQAIVDDRFIRVKVPVSSIEAAIAVRYKIVTLPTMMILKPDGTERVRCEQKHIGELPFRQQFLAGKKVD